MGKERKHCCAKGRISKSAKTGEKEILSKNSKSFG